MTTEQLPSPPSARSMSWIATPAAKAGAIIVLLLLMQIPLYMVSSLSAERQARQNDVLAGFRHDWGPAQTVAGPVLAVPYVLSRPDETPVDALQAPRHWVQIPAGQLSISANLQPELRRRGLFHAVVYAASLTFSGTFTIPHIGMDGKSPADLLWSEAVLVTAATDLRGQPADSTAELGGQTVKQKIQTLKGSCGGSVFAPAQISGEPVPGSTIPFRTSLVLLGTQSLNLLPLGRQIELFVSAPWRTPGFTGSSVPLNYGIDHAGFHADWQIGGDTASGDWHFESGPSPLCRKSISNGDNVVGVDLLEPVPTYLMLSRAAKYGTLFLALSFLTYFMFEAASRVRIHLAQYALLGLSVSLFALLLIALAEPFGFTTGYLLSTTAVMAQASLYTLSVVGSARLAAMFAGMLGSLFGFLYVVLSMETFALLVGTLALFVALSVIMVVTRRLDWGGRGPAGALSP